MARTRASRYRSASPGLAVDRKGSKKCSADRPPAASSGLFASRLRRVDVLALACADPVIRRGRKSEMHRRQGKEKPLRSQRSQSASSQTHSQKPALDAPTLDLERQQVRRSVSDRTFSRLNEIAESAMAVERELQCGIPSAASHTVQQPAPMKQNVPLMSVADAASILVQVHASGSGSLQPRSAPIWGRQSLHSRAPTIDPTTSPTTCYQNITTLISVAADSSRFPSNSAFAPSRTCGQYSSNTAQTRQSSPHSLLDQLALAADRVQRSMSLSTQRVSVDKAEKKPQVHEPQVLSIPISDNLEMTDDKYEEARSRVKSPFRVIKISIPIDCEALRPVGRAKNSTMLVTNMRSIDSRGTKMPSGVRRSAVVPVMGGKRKAADSLPQRPSKGMRLDELRYLADTVPIFEAEQAAARRISAAL